jgi:DNA-binding response OmpR family regulator
VVAILARALYVTRLDRNLTILIAEDDEDYSVLIQKAIRENGWNNPVRILPDGQEVMLYLEAADKYGDRAKYPFPSVMFLDIKMPRASGLDVLRWVRKHPEYSVLPTMMVSSSDQERDIKLAYQLGANGYFVKPASFEDLKAILKAAYEFWAWCAKPPISMGCGG